MSHAHGRTGEPRHEPPSEPAEDVLGLPGGSTDYRLFLPGRPPVQGSFRAVVSRSTGKAMVKPSSGDRNAAFRGDVREAVARAGWPTLDGPLGLVVVVWLDRPKSHFGSGRNAQTVKPSAPARPTGKPDLDKVLRAVGDALTYAGAWHDDAQVVRVVAAKGWSDPTAGFREGVLLAVQQITTELGG